MRESNRQFWGNTGRDGMEKNCAQKEIDGATPHIELQLHSSNNNKDFKIFEQRNTIQFKIKNYIKKEKCTI